MVKAVDRNAIRREMRAMRRAISTSEARHASRQLLRHLVNQPLFLRAKRIAVYLANDGEMDMMPLVKAATAMGKLCYLPILTPRPHRHLWFAPYDMKTPMVANRFGIPEPDCHHRDIWPVVSMDLVFTPLVAFDGQGNRLGMGGGFYDRTFAYLHQRKYWRRPRLVGVAYRQQGVECLPFEPWDVPLAAVATEAGFTQF